MTLVLIRTHSCQTLTQTHSMTMIHFHWTSHPSTMSRTLSTHLTQSLLPLIPLMTTVTKTVSTAHCTRLVMTSPTITTITVTHSHIMTVNRHLHHRYLS